MRTIKNFLQDESGFEGAEKALLICVGLAVIMLVGGLIRSGAKSAGENAETALKSNPLAQ
jgi:Flp pilus assembly pilin Flp